MEIKSNFNLAELTTFHIGGLADFYCVAQNPEDLKVAAEFAQNKNLPILILAGGSNMLVADSGFRGLVINIDIKGIEVNSSEFKVGSGEIWDEVVALAVLKDLWGIENLSNIPGKTGAIPIQNVGAYGQDASQVIKCVEVYDLENGERVVLQNEDCGFGYRQSNFNTIWKNKFVILNVTFRLSSTPNPKLGYLDVKNYFSALNNVNPTLTEIRQAIIAIRAKKFPDISQLGCAGSCFKNLILTPEEYLNLEQMVSKNFPSEAVEKLGELKRKFSEEKRIKIPAAFLIDICGLKGKTVGQAKLWENQPLVIVNIGGAKASDVAQLFKVVRQEVFLKTGQKLQSEPEWIGFTQKELDNYYQL